MIEAPTTPTQEYTLILRHILEEMGYTVGDQNDFKADITLNVDPRTGVIVVGSIRDDKSWGIAWGIGQTFRVVGEYFNLADPDSFQQITDRLKSVIDITPALPYHFNP